MMRIDWRWWQEQVLLSLYRLLYLSLCPFFLLWRSIRTRGRPQFSEEWIHKLGYYRAPIVQGKPVIWLHSASVGESRLAWRFVEHWAAKGDYHFVLSVGTTTGYQTLQSMCRQSSCSAQIIFAPLDMRASVQRALGCIRPQLLLLVESELWPELLYQARQKNVAVCVLNGRISDRSYRRLKHLPWLGRWLWGSVSQVLASCEETVQRLSHLCPELAVYSYGHIKCDVPKGQRWSRANTLDFLRRHALAHTAEVRVLMGVSTWSGEEALLLDVQAEALAAGQSCVLVLAPRHVERMPEVEALLQRRDVSFIKSSDLSARSQQWGLDGLHSCGGDVAEQQQQALGSLGGAVICVDQMGVLEDFFPWVDVAWVGKSLSADQGGQNPIEPLRYAVATVMGPGSANFRSMVQSMQRSGGLLQVSSSEEARAALKDLLVKQRWQGVDGVCWEAETLVEQGLAWLSQQQLAVARSVDHLDRVVRGGLAFAVTDGGQKMSIEGLCRSVE